MTMHIVFQTDKDGYKKDQSCYVERSLARRFCENGVAITHQKHLDNIYDAEQVIKKANAEKIEADEKKKADRKKAASENVNSKKVKKAVKK